MTRTIASCWTSSPNRMATQAAGRPIRSASPLVRPVSSSILRDAIGEGGTWTPSEYRLVGLDSQSNPVNDQVWAKFCGRIGAHLDNHLTAGTDYQRNGLSWELWGYIEGVNAIASAFNLMPSDATSGDGPQGLGVRPYIRPAG